MGPFEDCVRKGRLKQTEPDAERIASELGTAKEELDRARSCYLGGNWDEAVTQAYFCMYRCARAGINARGYRDTNLYGLCAAVQKLLVEPGEVDAETVKRIRDAKDIKDAVYDGHRASPHSARNLLQWAQVLAKVVFGKVALPGFDAAEIDVAIPEPPGHSRTHTSRPGHNPNRRDDWQPRRRY